MVDEICGGAWERSVSSYLALTVLLGMFGRMMVLISSQVAMYDVTVVEILSWLIYLEE